MKNLKNVIQFITFTGKFANIPKSLGKSENVGDIQVISSHLPVIMNNYQLFLVKVINLIKFFILMVKIMCLFSSYKDKFVSQLG